MEADAVFKKASCGLALHGTYVGGSSELIGSRRASKQLLRTPETCEFLKSDQAHKTESIYSSSIQAGEKFCEVLKDSGWTVASSISAGLFGLGVAAGGGQNRTKETNFRSDQMASEAYHVQYWYVPKASFCIARHQMRLSEGALADLRCIHTLEAAEVFLSHYNSHLSTGTYHVGGVLLKGVAIRSNSETTLETLLEKVSRKANVDAEASYMNVKGGVKVVYVDNNSSSSTRITDKQEALVRCVHTALGPQTDDEGKFKTELEDMSTWYIIDTSYGAELVPVWEIASMESDEDVREACDLLREAWERSVESAAALLTGRVYELWHQSHLQARTLKVTALLKELRASSSLQSGALHSQLSNLWIEATKSVKWEHSVQMCDRLRLFRDPDFQRLLTAIVGSTEADADEAKGLVRQILNIELQKLLEEKGVSLSLPVTRFLQIQVAKPIKERLLTMKELSALEPVDQTTPKLGDADKASSLTLQEADTSYESIKVLPYNLSYNKAGLYTYSGDFLVDRPDSSSCEDPCKRMMDLMRHRQEPFAAMQNTSHDKSNDDDDDDEDQFFGNSGNADPDASIGSTPDINSPLKILMQLLRRSDVLVQIAVLQVLLEERFAIPLMIPCIADSSGFRQLTEAFKFVQVKTLNQEILTIAENTSLPRVVFVSNRNVSQRETTDIACEVMNCQFPSKYCKSETGAGSTILELGVGFIENAKEQPLEHIPCLAFHVSGDHNKLGMILEKVGDIVIIEMDSGTQPTMPSWNSTRQLPCRFWSINPSGRGGDRRFDYIWGNFKDITKGINRYLLKTIKSQKFKGSNGEAMPLVDCLNSLPPLTEKILTFNSEHLATIQFEQVKASLSLQKLYTKEAEYYFESLQKRKKEKELTQQMQRCKEERARAAGGILELPILQFFIELLREASYVKRSVGILHLQTVIDQNLQPMLDEATRKVNDAFEKTQKNPTDSTLKKDYGAAKREHVDQMLGLEHLWRELSHIFVADSKRQSHLPKLAAQHLLDGHPLEILDGDATTFHKLWVDTVLIELDSELHAILERKPKVFVLSVVGLQSSGKSTLLNVMFGTKLKASAGMCTRGVFLQLVKSEWPEFDYLLILDTMGLRSPEFFGLKDSVAQDNRLATFAVLPADACVVMVANEEDNGLKAVLPMVMLAFKGSALAEKYGRKMQSKLFFVYRSVDTNDIKKLGKNQQKLQKDLTEASLAIADTDFYGKSSTPEPRDGASPLNDFQINMEDEKLSDVKYLGNVKTGTRPPGDTPDWEYGCKVEELRYYIHKRVLDTRSWKDSAHELVDWKDYLGMVWQSISEADFELSFTDYLEHQTYQAMQTRLATARQNVGKKWQDEFELLTNSLQANEDIGDQPLATLWKELSSKVEEAVKKEEDEVYNNLNQKQCQKWRVAETERWEADRIQNESHWKGQLRDCIEGVLRFDKKLKDYTNKIQDMISEAGMKYHGDKDSTNRKERMRKNFEELFLRIVKDAAINYPPHHRQVADRIHNIYLDHAELGRQFTFEDNKEKLRPNSGGESLWDSSKRFLISITPFLSGSSLRAVDEAEIESLKRKVLCNLEDARQYSEHLVRAMIKLTQQSGEGRPKRVENIMHELVKSLLTEKLTTIQEQWDSDHNVSKRIETQREYFWICFENHANKVDATIRLSTVLCNLVQQQYLVVHLNELITKSVSNELQSQPWVCNWQVMRAHMDLYLIELIETKQTDELLKCVANGAWHYSVVVDNFIETEIHQHLAEGDTWARLRDLICDCVATAAVKAGHPDPGSALPRALIFQKSIIKSLGHVAPELARLVSINVSEMFCSKLGDDLDFSRIQDEVTRRVRDIHIDPTSSVRRVMDMVGARMVNSKSESVRPRCDIMCPRCKVTCLHSTNHTGKHNALHQSGGLGGIRMETDELSWASCSKSIDLGYVIDVPGRPLYKDYWSRHHTEWTLPSTIIGDTKVREFIFANYQEQLVRKFKTRGNGKVKACSDIPSEYKLHKIEELRLELDNLIRSGT